MFIYTFNFNKILLPNRPKSRASRAGLESGGLGWGWAGLGWAAPVEFSLAGRVPELGWAGLGWAGLGLGWAGWVGLGWAGLGWAGLGCPVQFSLPGPSLGWAGLGLEVVWNGGSG